MPTILTRAGKGSALTHNELDANFSRTVRAVTGTDSVVASDNRNLIECNHATVAFTVTMITVALAAAEDTDGFETTFFNIGAAVASIDGDGTETINGATTAITLKQYDGVTLKLNSAGTGWDTIARVGDLGDVDVGAFTSNGIADNASSNALTLAAGGIASFTNSITIPENTAGVYLDGGTDTLIYSPSSNVMHLLTNNIAALIIDASQNATFAGTVTTGGNVVSDTDSTDDLGTTGVRWANLFVDDITVTGDIAPATITLDSIVQPKIKIVDIGDWNMDSTSSVSVTHNLTVTDIRDINVVIKSDSGNLIPLNADTGTGPGGYWQEQTTTSVTLTRAASGIFDNTGHDQTSFNRGWVTITYV